MRVMAGPERAGAVASLSIDLDNEWAYLKAHGDPAWQQYGSYLDVAVPRLLGVLADRRIQGTFFLVGEDAVREPNHAPLRSIADAGHEIANHTMAHEPWLHRYSMAEFADEVERAELAIGRATGQRTVGFRGPGFSLSTQCLKVLMHRGYLYDASTLPTLIGPIARAYYFATGQFGAEQRRRLKHLFGGWRDGLRPIRPYRWHHGDQSLIELPVTTFPGIRTPIHFSYINYLAGYSRRAAVGYFASAIGLCRRLGVEPSILLHPLDVLSGTEVPRLQFFPSMGQTTEQKMSLLGECLDLLVEQFAVTTMREHAERVSEDQQLRQIPVEAHA